MQLILLKKVANLGELGDIVTVKNGYARNYLIPYGIAKRATEANIQEFESRRAELEKKQADTLARAQAIAADLGGLMVQITRKASVDGRLFGSVTSRDIVEAALQAGHTVDRSAIKMPEGPLKQVGDVTLTVVLHPDVHTTITVSVLGEMAH